MENTKIKGTEDLISNESKIHRLFFGVDSYSKSNVVLQNNLELFEWVVRNKIHPAFFGRNISGENHLTKEEIDFIHKKGCKISAIYSFTGEKVTEEQGNAAAKNAVLAATELNLPRKSAIFFDINSKDFVSREFMRGFSKLISFEDFTPGFRANTDALYTFDREFSRGLKNDYDVFKDCLIWATSPSIEEFEGITSSHIIKPENWTPFAPSGLTRSKIAIWQYGANCHPIETDDEKICTFNLNLVRNEEIIKDYMF